MKVVQDLRVEIVEIITFLINEGTVDYGNAKEFVPQMADQIIREALPALVKEAGYAKLATGEMAENLLVESINKFLADYAHASCFYRRYEAALDLVNLIEAAGYVKLAKESKTISPQKARQKALGRLVD